MSGEGSGGAEGGTGGGMVGGVEGDSAFMATMRCFIGGGTSGEQG